MPGRLPCETYMTTVALNHLSNRLFSPESENVDGQTNPLTPRAATFQWHASPQHLSLAEDEVHIWRAKLDVGVAELQQCARVLSEDEHHRAGWIRVPHERRRFVAGRGMLRMLLGRYLDVAPRSLTFCDSATGKPGLAPESNRDLHFNVAHSNALAVYAVARQNEVGIDLEQICVIRDAEEIARCLFTARENAWLYGVAPAQYMEAFLRIWTLKEARLKACGAGIATGLKEREVFLPAEDSDPIETDAADTVRPFHWSMRDLTPRFRYVGAIVSKGHAQSFTIGSGTERNRSN